MQVPRKHGQVDSAGHPEGTPESAASCRLGETFGIDVQMRTPAGVPAGRIGNDVEIGETDRGNALVPIAAVVVDPTVSGRVVSDRDNPQQIKQRRALPATYTCSYRIRTTHHGKVYP